jgi:SAM-dependent methyltransferase
VAERDMIARDLPLTTGGAPPRSTTIGVWRKRLYRAYFAAEKAIAPGLRSSQYAYYEALRDTLCGEPRWLDLGCGHQVFGDWMTREQDEVVGKARTAVGIDLDWEGLRRHPRLDRKVFGTLEALPFQSGAYDVISANMVVEHLTDPGRVLREVHRLLRPGGRFVFHTPNFYHWGTLLAFLIPDAVKKPLIRFFEGRRAEDVFATHYRMNTAGDVRREAGRNGFRLVRLSLVSSSATLKMLGPVVLLELLYLRLIEHPSLASVRSNMVAVLQKVEA